MDLHLIAKVLIILFILISICTMNIFLLILTIVFAILYVCLSQQPTKYKYLKKKPKKRIKTTQSSPSTQSTQSISYDTLTTPTVADTTNTATNTEPSFQSNISSTDRISYNTSLNSSSSENDVILSSKNAQFFQERAFSQVSNTASKNRMLVPEPVENRNNLEVQARSLQPPYLISQDSTGGRLPDYMRNVKIRST